MERQPRLLASSSSVRSPTPLLAAAQLLEETQPRLVASARKHAKRRLGRPSVAIDHAGIIHPDLLMCQACVEMRVH